MTSDIELLKQQLAEEREKRLKAEQRFFYAQQMLQHAGSALATVDAQGKITFANRAFEWMSGLNASPIGLTIGQAGAWKEKDLVEAIVRETFLTGQWNGRLELENNLSLTVTFNSLTNAQGKVLQLIASFTIAEDNGRQQLQRLEKQLSDTQHLTGTGTFSANFKTGEMEWSEETFRIFGLAGTAKRPSSKLFFERIHPDDLPSLTGQIDRAISRQAPLQAQCRLLLPDGQVRHILLYLKPDTTTERTQIFSGLVRDQSEQAKAEQQNRQSDNSFRLMLETSGIALWEWDTTTNRLWVSDNFYRQYFIPTDRRFSIDDFVKLVHQADRDEVQQAMEEMLRLSIFAPLYCRIVLPVSGEIRSLCVQAQKRNTSESDFTIRGTIQDVSEIRRTTAEIEYEQYLLQHAQDALITTDLHLTVRTWNETAEEMYGWKADEAIGQNLEELIHTADLADGRPLPVVEQTALLRKNFIKQKVAQRNRYGKNLIVSSICRIFRDMDEQPQRILFVNRNLTEQVQTDEQAHKWRQTLQLLFDNIPGWIVLLDSNLTIMGCNRNFAKAMYADNDSELIGKSYFDLPVSEDFARKSHESSQRVLTEKKPMYHVEEPMRSPNGKTYLLDTNRVPLRDQDGNMMGVLVTVEDVTEKRAIEEQLRAQEIQQEKIRTMSIIQGQEDERKRVSMELHDGVGQVLTALQMQTNYLAAQYKQEHHENLGQIAQLVDKAKQEIRRISYNLMPSILDDFGLQDAIESMASVSAKNTPVHVETDIELSNSRFGRPVEVGVFRIVQEALNNALKYSQADTVYIRLRAEKGLLTLRVQDNGLGFDSTKPTFQKGNGLTNLKQRAHLLNGTLEIHAGEGEGCTVTAEIPAVPLEK
jgi:PAS domain S-box-containing protein